MKHSNHLAENAQYNGKCLVPVAGSPISALVSSIAGINESGSNSEIIALSQRANTSVGTHSQITTDIVKGTARILGNIISNARNEVNPKIRQVIEKIETARKEYAENRASLGVTIRQVELSSLLTDEMFTESVRIYSESSRLTPETNQKIQMFLKEFNNYFTNDEIVELIKTGSAATDERISSFVEPVLSSGNYLTDATAQNNGIKLQVLFFMILTGINNGRLEKAEVLTSDEERSMYIVQLKAAIGRQIHEGIVRFTKAIQRKDVVVPPSIQRPEHDGEILVIGKIYREWIKNGGGSPEAVLGYTINNGNSYNAAAIDSLRENPARFVTEYERRIQHMRTVGHTNDVDIVNRNVNDCINRMIKDMECEGNVKAGLRDRLKKHCDAHPYYGKAELQSYVRDLICAVFTEGDQVKRILVEIDSVLGDMDKPDMKYAVYVATNRLVACWIAEQVTIDVE